MTASPIPAAREGTKRWLCTTRQWRLKRRPPTIARDIFKYSLSAAIAWTFVTQVLACMIAAFQEPPTGSGAYMFCLNTVVEHSGGNSQWPHLSPRSLPIGCFSFTCATSLAALMSATVECCPTDTHTLRVFFLTLVTCCIKSVPAAATCDFDHETAWWAFTEMTDLRT